MICDIGERPCLFTLRDAFGMAFEQCCRSAILSLHVAAQGTTICRMSFGTQQHLRSKSRANSYHFKIRPQLFFSSSVIPWTDESYILAKPLIACFKNSHRRENLISEPLRILDGRQFTNSLSFVKKWSVWHD